MSEEPGMIERFIRIVKARRRPFIAVLVLIPLAALAYSLFAGKDYTASSTLLVRAAGAGGEAGDSARAAQTTRDLLETEGIARRAARSLGTSVEDVEDAVEIKGSDDSNAIGVEASDDDAERAATISNTYSRSFIAQKRARDADELDAAIARLRLELEALTPAERAGEGGRTLQSRIEELRASRALSESSVTIAQAAAPPAEAEPKHVVRNVALGALAGLILASMLAWLLERLDRRVRTVEQLEEIYELPILSRIPRSRALNVKKGQGQQRPGEDVVTKASGFSEEAEAFRILRANLRYFNVDRQVRSVLIASPLSGDGKSTTARFLAMTMAAMGDRVVLVDADLRKRDPTASRVEQQAEGLSLVLAGFDLDDALTEIPVAFNPISEESRSVFKLPSGPLPPNPSELLESARMRWVIHELEQRFDCVIIDSPALAVVSDALALVPQVSGIMIVSGFRQTTRHAALGLRKQIAMLGGRPLGIVANFWKPEGQDDYYYYKYEQYTPQGQAQGQGRR
jgi:capsular exopolysaccharide synthesis family protein